MTPNPPPMPPEPPRRVQRRRPPPAHLELGDGQGEVAVLGPDAAWSGVPHVAFGAVPGVLWGATPTDGARKHSQLPPAPHRRLPYGSGSHSRPMGCAHTMGKLGGSKLSTPKYPKIHTCGAPHALLMLQRARETPTGHPTPLTGPDSHFSSP